MHFNLDTSKISGVVDEGNTLKFIYSAGTSDEMSFLMTKYIKNFNACYRVKINGISMVENEVIDQETIAFWVEMQNKAFESKCNYQEKSANYLVDRLKVMGVTK